MRIANEKLAHIARLLADPFGDDRRLTPRQREIAGLVARGWTRTEIADALHISPHTVSVIVTAIRVATGMHREDLVRWLFERIGAILEDQA